MRRRRSVTAPTVNRWADAAHAHAYLESRDRIPHRDEGYAELLEVLAAAAAGARPRHRRRRPARVGAEPAARRRGRRRRLLGHHARGGAGPVRRHRRGDASSSTTSTTRCPRSGPSTPSCRRSPSTTSPTRLERALYGEVFERLEPGGLVANLEHVSSPTERLHEEFLVALGKDPDDEDPSNSWQHST